MSENSMNWSRIKLLAAIPSSLQARTSQVDTCVESCSVNSVERKVRNRSGQSSGGAGVSEEDRFGPSCLMFHRKNRGKDSTKSNARSISGKALKGWRVTSEESNETGTLCVLARTW